MSASDLTQEKVDKAEGRPLQPKQQRYWLGIFRRNSHHLAAENNHDGDQTTPLPSVVERDNSPSEPGSNRPEEQAAVLADQPPLFSDNNLDAADALAVQAAPDARLPERANEIDTLAAELANVRAQLAERDAALQMQLNVNAEQRAMLESLRGNNEAVETELHMAQAKIEQMALDQENLEAALTASIQHAAEQQDALVRWQELAESADECVTGLEKQITFLQQALHDCNDQRESLHQEYEETSQALAHAEEHLESLQHHQETVAQLDQAQRRISELEQSQAATAEKLSWYKSSLSNSRRALIRAGLQLGEQEKTLRATREQLALREQTIGRSRATFERLAAGLRLKHSNEKKLQDKVSQLSSRMVEERAQWYKVLKRNEQQLAATEKELDHFWQGYHAQGQRLADIQAALLDREHALAESRTRLQQQTQLLHYMRQAADERITQLEASLAQAEQRTRDLQMVVERRAKRETEDGER